MAQCRVRSLLLNSWLKSAAGIQPPATLEALTAAQLPAALAALRSSRPEHALNDLEVFLCVGMSMCVFGLRTVANHTAISGAALVAAGARTQ